MEVEFIISSPDLRGLPEPDLPEFAFLGRSNCGKSSLINHFLDRTSVARTSRKPGKTRLFNYFRIDKRFYIVDLPGYGFAKVPLAIKNEWEKLMTLYLSEQQALNGLVVIMDIRHPLNDYDRQMLEWCHLYQLPAHVLTTHRHQ